MSAQAPVVLPAEAIVEELEGLQQQKRDNPDYQDQVGC